MIYKAMNNNLNNNEKNIFQQIASDRVLRQKIGYENHYLFFVMYFAHYIKYAIAEFHKDIFRITEDTRHALACIVAFRGSGKSTLITFSYAIWAVLGVQQKKFILIICQTQAQARQHMANLKYELENNQLLKSDMGPFREEIGSGEWAMSSLVFRNTGARIMIASIEQSIRGIRHREHRPDLIILDDIENTDSTRTFEGRTKVSEWFSREIVPLGDIGTRILMVGNLVHEDSLMMRIKQKIDNKELDGIYRWFPLLDEQNKCLWPEKFDTPEKIEDLRLRVGNEIAWRQEYLLQAVSDTMRVVFPEWIHYYDELPSSGSYDYRYTAIGLDLAISEKDTADYTGMVAAMVFGRRENMRAYILPNPVNERLTFPQQVDRAKLLSSSMQNAKLFIEDVGYQRALVQELKRQYFDAEGVQVHGLDKRARLATITHHIQSGKILFPKVGAEKLIYQLTGFGNEKHDDLADAFSILGHKIIEKDTRGPRVFEFKPEGF